MNMLITLLLYTQATAALAIGCGIAAREDKNVRDNWLVFLHSGTVFFWNIGYVILINSADDKENLRCVCRSVIMLSVFLSIILCHSILMQAVSIRKKTADIIIMAEIITGLLVYPMIVARDSVEYIKVGFGWTYRFVTSYTGRTAYNIYITGISVAVAVTAVYGLIKGSKKRERSMAKYGALCVGIMALGMLTDTILPMTHKVVIPGSACAMFICLIIIYVNSVRRNVDRLTVSNVSPYIFSTIDTPMVILDDENKVTIMNKAAGDFFGTFSDKVIGRGIERFFDIEGSETEKERKELTYDAKCKTNDAFCRLQFSYLEDVYGDRLGSLLMITDVTDKMNMISELEMYHNYLQEKLQEKTKELETVTLQAISAVANTIDAKDDYTKGHSVRVAEYSAAIAEKVGMDEEFISNLNYMALLHDIGKIGVPDSVLNKAGRLNETEFSIIKQHTTIGAEILKDITMVKGVVLGAKYHHERYDGSGYPDGIKGEDIPLEARIIGIADAYDAMTSNRVYRDKLPMEAVLEQLEKGKGTQFDPQLTEITIELIKEGKLVAGETEFGQTLVGEGNQLLMNILEKQNETNRLEADYDYLTKLYNRKAAEREINMLLKKKSGILMILDLDHFKSINDTYGHLMGDYVLKVASSCIRDALPENAIVSRQGGDEFIAFLTGVTDKEEALRWANDIRSLLRKKAGDDVVVQRCSFSIGLSLPGIQNSSYADMFAQADKALYHVKQAGRDNSYMYDDSVKKNGVVSGRKDIEQIIRILRDGGSYDGAFHIEVQELKRVYEFARHLARRYNHKMQILLFSLELESGDEDAITSMENAMQALQLAIKMSLRRVDVSTRYSSTQMVVMLLDSSRDGVAVAANKVIQNFYKVCTKEHINVFYDSQDFENI